MVLRIGFCLRTTLKEMNDLLILAGVSPLFPKIRRDAVLIYTLQKKYSMDQANELLIKAGEAPMFWNQQK